MRITGLLRIILISGTFLLAACDSLPVQNSSEAVEAPEPTGVLATDVEVTEPTGTQVWAETTTPLPEPLTSLPADKQPDSASSQPGDIWQKLSDNLNLPRHLDHRTVKGKLAWYAKNQEYLDRVATRSSPYLFYIIGEVEKRGMPLELALLPVVESAYHPFAYSRSHASGIWQFIPSTGKIYGLKQNWWYDGRRDIVASTRAALDYLEKLNKEFDGDWLLALAAYNSGERNVARAIRRNKRAGKKTDFFSLRLPRETRGYVPSLLAVSELVANPEQYGVNWIPVVDRPYFAQVNTGEQIDLAVAAELADLSMDELYTLNPGFNRWATDPAGPHRLLVPVAREKSFLQKLTQLAEGDRINWQRHVINQGETLGQIASRYHTSVAALKSVNNLRSNLIRRGHSLLVPIPKEATRHYSLSLDSRHRRGLKSADGNKYIYTVRRGDTLWHIGRRYGVSTTQLARWNGISQKRYLQPGQKLNLWLADADKKLPSTSANKSRADKDPFHYIVKKGDSLWLIAKKFNVTVKQLLAWNNLRKNKYLYPNQKLTVYQNLTQSVGI